MINVSWVLLLMNDRQEDFQIKCQSSWSNWQFIIPFFNSHTSHHFLFHSNVLFLPSMKPLYFNDKQQGYFCEWWIIYSLPVRPFLNKSVLVLTCSTVARSDLSFTLYLQRAANQNVSHTSDIIRNVNSTEMSSHVRVGFFLFLHRRHFIDHRVGVIQLVWNQNQQPDLIFNIMNWFTDSPNRSHNLHSGSTSLSQSHGQQVVRL